MSEAPERAAWAGPGLPAGAHLSVEGIVKSFPYGGERLEVLKGVTFGLPRGSFASIVGVSGSGKSTLLHVLGGMEPPDSGRVSLGEDSVYDLDGDARARLRNRKVGFVFQFHHLLPEFDAVENLAMPLLIRGVARAAAKENALSMLDSLGLAERRKSRPAQLSGGEQQRLAIGRALITRPELLLMDEPTGNLDPGTGERIMDLVISLTRKNSVTSILVTHNQAMAAQCPLQLEMRAGNLFFCASS